MQVNFIYIYIIFSFKFLLYLTMYLLVINLPTVLDVNKMSLCYSVYYAIHKLIIFYVQIIYLLCNKKKI